jgi:hypothetical protein
MAFYPAKPVGKGGSLNFGYILIKETNHGLQQTGSTGAEQRPGFVCGGMPCAKCPYNYTLQELRTDKIKNKAIICVPRADMSSKRYKGNNPDALPPEIRRPYPPLR